MGGARGPRRTMVWAPTVPEWPACEPSHPRRLSPIATRGRLARPQSPLRPALPLRETDLRLHPPGALLAPARRTGDSPARRGGNQLDTSGLCPALSTRLGLVRRPGQRGRFIGALDMGARRLVRGLAVRQPMEIPVHGVPILLNAETYRGASSLWLYILLPPAFAVCLSVQYRAGLAFGLY